MYMNLVWVPGSDVLPPGSESLPHSELGKSTNLDQLVKVLQVTHPLDQVCELGLSASDHACHSMKTEGGVV